MAWQKGQSGNPGGRAKMSPEERAKWANLAERGREKLEALMESAETPPQIITKITEIAANRAWGTPPQSIELSDPEGGPVGFRFVSPPDATVPE